MSTPKDNADKVEFQEESTTKGGNSGEVIPFPANRWRGKLLTPLGAATTTIGRAEQLVSGWMPAHGLVAVLSKRGDGKTVTMLGQALSLATDRDWQGRKTACGFYAVYLCGEDQEGALDHARAWYRHHGVSFDDPSVRFVFVPMVPDLLSKDDCKKCGEEIQRMLPADAKVVVFIDTWQRATMKVTQNDDANMQEAAHNAELLGRAVGGPVVAAFHPPKHNPSTISGSLVIENDTTAIWHLTVGDGGVRRLEVTRIKGKGLGNKLHMEFKTVPLGERDQFGDECTGAVAVSDQWGDEAEKAKRAKIIAMREGGKSLRKIAKEVGISKDTVGRIIKA